MRQLATERSSQGQPQGDRRTVVARRPVKGPGVESDRLRTAVNELVAVLRDEIASGVGAWERSPDRLLSIEQAAEALGIGRTALYSEIGAGRIRTIKVGRRRLIPSSAISEVASGRE
jgi:excisionase family DNA binding protein